VRKLLTLLACAAGALLLATSAMASDGGLGPVDSVSPNGQKAGAAYWLVFAFTAAIFVLVEGALIVFIIRFRSRGRDRSIEGPDIHGSTKLETVWTIFPVVVLAIIATFIFVNLPGYIHPAKADKRNALQVHIIAHQFYWEFRYPNGVLAYDTMVVPANTLVELTIDSADVAHSWWIPAFGPKTDAIPGQTNHAWFKAQVAAKNLPILYTGQCSELCGLLHAKMTQHVKVVSAAEYQVWFRHNQALSLRGLGQKEFTASCAKCHGADAQGFIGPAIATSSIPRDAKTLTPLLFNGKGRMPAVGTGWSTRQIAAIVAYFKSNPKAFNGGTSGK
jgi:cytochrome c oxidase subunit 2